MLYIITKISLSALLIVLISEISKRSVFFGSLTASLPLVSILAFFWIYLETKDIEQVSNLSKGIFWLVIPSLTLFISLPQLLKIGLHFYTSISISILLTILSYILMLKILAHFGIDLS